MLEDVGADDGVVLLPAEELAQPRALQIAHYQRAIERLGVLGGIGIALDSVDRAIAFVAQVLPEDSGAGADVENRGAPRHHRRHLRQ